MHIFYCLLLGESHALRQQWGDCCHVKDIYEKVSDPLGGQLPLASSRQRCAGWVPLSRRRMHFITLEDVDTGGGHLVALSLFISTRVVSDLRLQMTERPSSEAETPGGGGLTLGVSPYHSLTLKQALKPPQVTLATLKDF